MAGSNPDLQFRNTIIAAIVTVVAITLAVIFIFSSDEFIVFKQIGQVMAYLWWVILPIPVYKLFYLVWEEYSGLMFVLKQKPILLEIRPSSDVEKSPKIMEQVFAGLHTYSGINKFEKYCGWRPVQDKFVFEIASIEGTVHFYVRCPLVARNLVEALIYSQYPDVEIFEAEDYTQKVPRNLPNPDWDVWGTVMKLQKEDGYPLRTYRKFIEDVTGKMIDPLSSLVESFAQLGPSQHAWLQIIFTPMAESEWQKGPQAILDKLAEKAEAKKPGFGQHLGNFIGNIFRGIIGEEYKSLEVKAPGEFNINKLTPGQQEIYKAIYESISKEGFATAIRYCYLAKKEFFNKALGVAGGMGAIKQFADLNLNSLIPDNRTKTYALYYFTDSRLKYRQRKIINDYRGRDFAGLKFVLNIEELATLYHFPDMSVKSPAINRIQAKKGEAPFNLPIQ